MKFSLADAARFATEAGDSLEAGFVVLAGGATAAVALEPDTAVRLEIEALGSTGFNVITWAAEDTNKGRMLGLSKYDARNTSSFDKLRMR